MDDANALNAAVNLQLIDGINYDDLHGWIQGMSTRNHTPYWGGNGPTKIDWSRPRVSAERWIVLRAVQLGAIEDLPPDHPVPCTSHPDSIYRWSEGDVTVTALPGVFGMEWRGVRWELNWEWVSPWTAGKVLHVVQGTSGQGNTWKGPRWTSINIPPSPQVLIKGCS